MTWTGTFFGSSAELFQGVPGYFDLSVMNGIPVEVIANTPTQVIFGVDNNLGRISFFGQNLTVGTTRLANGLEFPVFTGGTLTGLEAQYNHLLAAVIDTGGPIDPALFLPSNLGPSASLQLPNVSAAALSNAIVQSNQTGNPQILRNFFSADSHVYTGTNDANLIAGYDGDDRLTGLGGNDFLQGEGGNDVLDGGPGTDGLNGGPGSDLYLPGPPGNTPVGDSVSDNGTAPGEIDTVSYANATGPVVVDLNFSDGDQSAGWARGAQIGGVERVVGSAFGDVLHGKALDQNPNDILEGGAGDDTLVGHAGSDILQGGPGFDLLIGGENGSIVGPGPGDVARFAAASSEIDVFFGNDGSVSVAAPGGGVDRLVEVEFIQVTDGTFPVGGFSPSARALIVGNADGDTRSGGPGPDLMFGRGGNDVLDGSDGDDSIEGEAGDDRLSGGDGSDRLDGGNGADLLDGGADDDTLLGGDGTDLLEGGDGNDRIVGGATTADLRDVVSAGNGDDDVDGGHGNDQLNGGPGNDTLAGGFGADSVRGNAGDDVLTGSAFSDLIFGGPGFDFVNGGFGFDRVNGGDDADRFFHTGDAGHGSDWIQDYDAGEGDLLFYGGPAQPGQFRVITTETRNAGEAGVEEAFVVYGPTGQILWALVDGSAQDEINLSLGGQVVDLFG